MASPETLAAMNSRPLRILVETPRYRIVGTLVLPRDGYRSRLSDFLNSSDRDFISLTDVSMEALDAQGHAGQAVTHEFITVSRGHIVLATTVDGHGLGDVAL
jgi:hypothetical protein